jgi:hypothetical protein
MNDESKCAHCGSEPSHLWENPKRYGEFLCFNCLDKAAPAYVNKYPGWRERERKRGVGRRKSEVGKNKNQSSPTSYFLFPISNSGLSAPLPAARSKPKAETREKSLPALLPL